MSDAVRLPSLVSSLLILAAGLAGAATAGPISGEIELGLLSLNEGVASASGFHGPVTERGLHPLGRLDLSIDGNRGRTRIAAHTDGRDTARVDAGIRTWKGSSLRVRLGRLVRRGDDAMSLHEAGSNRLALVPGVTPAEATTGLDLSYRLPVALRTRREFIGVTARLRPADAWEAEVEVRELRRRGLVETGALVGAGAVTARSSILPEPVQHMTRELEASTTWEGSHRQLRATYRGSVFQAGEDRLGWEVPFVAGTDADPFPRWGQLALAPPSQHHAVSLDGGMRLGRSARLSGVATAARLQQNEALLPYSTATDVTDLPRRQAEARADVVHLRLNASARPVSNLLLQAVQTYHRHRDRTPVDIFERIIGDTAPAEDATPNRPYSHFHARTRLHAALQPRLGTRIQAAFGQVLIGRDLQATTGHTRETSGELRLQQALGGAANLRLGATQAVRSRRGFDTGSAADALSCSDPIGPLLPSPGSSPRRVRPCLRDHPDLRRFFVAERRRSRFHGTVDWWPHETLDLEAGWSLTNDHHPEADAAPAATLGLRSMREQLAHVGASWTPHYAWQVHGGYTREHLDARQAGQQFSRARPGSMFDPDGAWSARSHDRIDTVHAGLGVDLPDGRTHILAEVGWIREANRTEVESPRAPQPLPDDGARRAYIDLEGRREVDDRYRIRAGLRWEHFRSHDRADQGIDAGGSPALTAVLPLRGGETHYDLFLVWTSLSYRW